MYSKEELKALKKEFWEGFDTFCSYNKELGLRKKKWILYDTKVKGVDMKFDANREGAFVILEINLRDAYERKLMFEKIQSFKKIIESEFDNPLTWEETFMRETGNEVSRIYTKRLGLDIHKRLHWLEFYRFMAANMLKMETIFEEIKDFLKK
jgi:hypothetical protein